LKAIKNGENFALRHGLFLTQIMHKKVLRLVKRLELLAMLNFCTFVSKRFALEKVTVKTF
jgi:hypothetical protein